MPGTVQVVGPIGIDTPTPPYGLLGVLRAHFTVGEPAHGLFQEQLTVAAPAKLVGLHVIDGVGGVVGAGGGVGAGGAVGAAVLAGGAVTTGALVGAGVIAGEAVADGLGLGLAVGVGVGRAVGLATATTAVLTGVFDGEGLGGSVTRMVRGVGPDPLVAAIST